MGCVQDILKETVKKIESQNFKTYYQNQIKSTENEKQKFYSEIMLKHPAIDKKPEGYNFGNNDGEVAGRTIHHLHIHIIPRYFGDIKDPIGGIRTIIPHLGNYKR